MLSGAFSISFMTFPAFSTRSDSLSCAKSGRARARAGIKLSSLFFMVHPQVLSRAAAFCGIWNAMSASRCWAIRRSNERLHLCILAAGPWHLLSFCGGRPIRPLGKLWTAQCVLGRLLAFRCIHQETYLVHAVRSYSSSGVGGY